MVCRWAQEFLGYHFSIVHRSNNILADVDALTRRFGTLTDHHCLISSILHHTDKINISEAYYEAVFTKEDKVNVRIEFQEDRQQPVIIIANTIKYYDIMQQVPGEI